MRSKRKMLHRENSLKKLTNWKTHEIVVILAETRRIVVNGVTIHFFQYTSWWKRDDTEMHTYNFESLKKDHFL